VSQGIDRGVETSAGAEAVGLPDDADDFPWPPVDGADGVDEGLATGSDVQPRTTEAPRRTRAVAARTRTGEDRRAVSMQTILAHSARRSDPRGVPR
jgi:hypothetical protein